MSQPVADAVVVAAGRGSRLEAEAPKQFLELAGEPMLRRTLRAFRTHPAIHRLVVVLPATEAIAPPDWIREISDHRVEGGPTRAASVSLGLSQLGGEVGRVLVHDGVRPFVSPELIARVIEACGDGPAIPIVPVPDTVKLLRPDGWVERTLDRARLGLAQTPQGFPTQLLRRLHAEQKASAENEGPTDDAAMCEAAGVPVRTVPGDPLNLKITTSADLEYARWLLEQGRIHGG